MTPHSDNARVERRSVIERLAQIGAQLKAARLRAGLGRDEVARRANVPTQIVSDIEAGNPECQVDALVAVAVALDHQILAQPPRPPNTGEQAAHELIEFLRRPRHHHEPD